MFWYRIAHFLYKMRFTFIALMIMYLVKLVYSVEIHPKAQIGKNLFIDHGMGTVIGETAIIGNNCLFYHNITLGSVDNIQSKRHPTIGNNVMISAGAKVLGPINIGDNSRVAAGAVVLKDVPPNSTVVGVPARVVRQDGKKVEYKPLDQIHISDPVQQQLDRLEQQIKELKGEK